MPPAPRRRGVHGRGIAPRPPGVEQLIGLAVAVQSADVDVGVAGVDAPRQPALEQLMLAVARVHPDRRFIVAGPGYPTQTTWPPTVLRIENVSAADHRAFYTGQRFTLNLTRGDMIRAGHSPSVRLFEAAACGVPIISD